MNLNSARIAWHDAFYSPWDSVMSYAMELAKLGTAVQTSGRTNSAGRVAHQTMSGHIQMAIDTLPASVAMFGHWLYNPAAGDDHREIAEELVFAMAAPALGRMTERKRERSEYVAKGVLHRYRRMNQGGSGANQDPLAAPEAFRQWLSDEYGVELASESWTREWGSHVEAFFEACNELDRMALRPVALVLEDMRAAA